MATSSDRRAIMVTYEPHSEFRVAFESTAPAQPAGSAEPWLTPEGIRSTPLQRGRPRRHRLPRTWPGIAPYLRGPYPTMYVNQPWTIRRYAGFSTAEIPTRSIAVTSPPGKKVFRSRSTSPPPRLDSDHPRVSGDVGMAGVAMNSIYDMRTLFAGIPLDQMSVSMT